MMRPCLDCGRRTEGTTRCRDCEAKRQFARNNEPERKRRLRNWAWQKESLELREKRRRCEDCGTEDDLTVDHIPGGGRQVLCRSCHSALEAKRRADRCRYTSQRVVR